MLSSCCPVGKFWKLRTESAVCNAVFHSVSLWFSMLARSWPQLEQNCLSHSEMHSKDHVLSGNPNWFPCSPPPTSQRQNVSQRFPARNSGPIWTRIKTSGAGERAQWLRVLAAGVGDLAQWQSTCLASTRPWVRSSALERKTQNNKRTKKTQGNWNMSVTLDRFLVVFTTETIICLLFQIRWLFVWLFFFA